MRTHRRAAARRARSRRRARPPPSSATPRRAPRRRGDRHHGERRRRRRQSSTQPRRAHFCTNWLRALLSRAHFVTRNQSAPCSASAPGNTEWTSPRTVRGKLVRALLADSDCDILCVTEGTEEIPSRWWRPHRRRARLGLSNQEGLGRSSESAPLDQAEMDPPVAPARNGRWPAASSLEQHKPRLDHSTLWGFAFPGLPRM